MTNYETVQEHDLLAHAVEQVLLDEIEGWYSFETFWRLMASTFGIFGMAKVME